MPRVPQREQQVQDAGLPGVRLGGAPSPKSYGTEVGELTSQIGLALYEQEAIAADRTAVFEADRKAADLQLALQGKLQQAKGKNVLGLDEVLKKEWDEGIATIDSELQNNRQHGQFSTLSQRRGLQLNGIAQQHIATEYGRFEDGETDRTIESAQTMIRANPDNPTIITNEMNRALSAARAQAQRKGEYGQVTEGMFQSQEFRKPYEQRGEVTPGVGEEYITETFTQRQAEIKSGLHSAVINGFLAKNQDLLAKQYFDQHEHDLIAKDRQSLEKIVLDGSTIGQARRMVNQWISGGYNEYKMLEEARLQGEKNPKLGELLHNYSAQYWADQQIAAKRVDERNHETFVRDLKERIAADPGRYHDPRQELGLDTFLQLPSDTQRYLEMIAKEAVHPTDRPNDDKLWLDFLALKPMEVANLSRKDFDTTYWAKLDNSHRVRAESQWNTYRDALAKQDDKTAELKLTPTLTFKDQVNNAWALSGLIDPAKERSKWSTDEMKQFVRFEDAAAKAVQQYEMTKLEGKRHATPDEVRDIIKGVRDQLTKKVFTEGWFGKNERPILSLGEDEKGKVFVPVDKIPPAEADDLRRYIESQGKTVTADKLRRAYGQYVLGNRAEFNRIVNE